MPRQLFGSPADSSTAELEGEQQSTEPAGEVGIGIPRDHGVVTVFHESKILATWGYVMLKTQVKFDSEKTFPGILTSTSRLPVDRPYLYMPKATFYKLPLHAKALKSFVKITPHGLRTPWRTGFSVVQLVNSDMLVYGQARVGLNAHMDTGMFRVTRGASGNTMKATSVQPFSETDHATLGDGTG
ncbi:hypothetical protein V5799_012178 [Amblyomma americanum]|uniref:Uncharacterized protein n=1 Tax=Amblyomma americanum TaxID=6943 RepID=A0AAQ4EES0_AMBAM